MQWRVHQGQIHLGFATAHCWAGQAAQARPPLYSPTVTARTPALQPSSTTARRCATRPGTSHSDPVRRTRRGTRRQPVTFTRVTENSEQLFATETNYCMLLLVVLSFCKPVRGGRCSCVPAVTAARDADRARTLLLFFFLCLPRATLVAAG